MRPAVLILFLAASAAAVAGEHVFHVATDGSDDNPGTLQRPFASLTKARDAARGHGSDSRTIIIHAGTYYLGEPLVLTHEDSGTKDAPLRIEAADGERPVISGGRRLTGWQVHGNTWQLEIAEVKAGNWNFIDLFADGSRCPRPRLPKDGWFKIAAELPPSGRKLPDSTPGHDQFKFAGTDLLASWSNLTDVEVLVPQTWRMHRLRIADIDQNRRIVRFTGSTGGEGESSKMKDGGAYLVENVREAMDSPGEWYLDRGRGLLTYMPRPGETPEKTAMVAPRLDAILRIEGTAGNPVHHIVLKGLTFAHSLWETPGSGHCFSQAEADVPSAVRVQFAHACAFEKCDITLTGGYAIELGAGTRDCSLDDCEITQMGAGGVRIGRDPRQPVPKSDDDPEFTSGNTVRNCLIAHGGRLHPAAVGVWIGNAAHNVIDHCEITDFYYTGVSLGWSWGYQPSLAHHNTISYCEISNIGQRLLNDMGGIYTLGNGPGNVIRGNHIHHIDCRPGGYGGWGLYHDEGSTGFLSEDNVVHHTSSTPFHQHYGRDNVVRNNVFAFGAAGALTRSREEAHISFILERNVILSNGTPFFVSTWNNGNYRLDSNLYWDFKNPDPRFPGNRSFAAWQSEVKQDVHSILADPLLDVSNENVIRFQKGSPISKIGFQPIDVSKAGRQTPRRAPAQSVRPAWPKP